MSSLSSPLTSAAKNDGTVALVKSGSEIVKTTPADEYCQQALLSLIEKSSMNGMVNPSFRDTWTDEYGINRHFNPNQRVEAAG
ncbi:hypothetical protein KIW84_050242 [Lathyrus oleraceus]|uniref:Uncharacterized protein n=1 Tax=Pisum sativum TaxID=3888 RepID=A0A9D5AED0_PEA|nr:hypothetical protein KIW84_050242 [Pisum sativum]